MAHLQGLGGHCRERRVHKGRGGRGRWEGAGGFAAMVMYMHPPNSGATCQRDTKLWRSRSRCAGSMGARRRRTPDSGDIGCWSCSRNDGDRVAHDAAGCEGGGYGQLRTRPVNYCQHRARVCTTFSPFSSFSPFSALITGEFMVVGAVLPVWLQQAVLDAFYSTAVAECHSLYARESCGFLLLRMRARAPDIYSLAAIDVVGQGDGFRFRAPVRHMCSCECTCVWTIGIAALVRLQ